MEKITKEEFEKLHIKGRGRSSHVYNGIYNLQPGELLKILKSDWKNRTSPSRVASYIAKKHNRKYETFSIISDGGWVVKRIS